MAENKTEIARREERGVARSEPFFEPFRMMDRFVDEMDRVFEDVFGRGWLTPRLGRTSLRSPWRASCRRGRQRLKCSTGTTNWWYALTFPASPRTTSRST